MATKGILQLDNGRVVLRNTGGQIERIYYTGKDATRVDWYDQVNESIQVQLNDGRVFIINKACQIEKRIPNAKGQM
jgi:hypothetical protein